MWQYHDKKMKELKQEYNKISKQTQNRLQEIFDSIDFDFNNLYQIANTKTKNRINTYIEEWKDKGLLNGYFGMLANNIYKRTRVKNSEILEILIYSAYIEEQYKLDEIEKKTMYDDANYYYQEGQKEVNKTSKKKKSISVLDMALFLYLLEQPNAKGYVWNQYIETIIKYNAEQIYRQMTIDLQQQKELDITNDTYQNIIKRQGNSKLNVNGDKISGEMDLTLTGINNQAKLQGIYSFDDKAKVRFISAEDKVTTKMCHSLNNQEFYIHDWNEFKRYSKTNDSIVKYRCYGLIVGLNCPPINDGFHWCRSYVEYLPTEKEDLQENNDESDVLDSIKTKIASIVYDEQISKFKDLPLKYRNNFLKILNNSENNTKIILTKECENTNYIITNEEKSLYNNVLNVVKVNTEKTESTLAHELFHKIDKKYKISKSNKVSNYLALDFKTLKLNRTNIINQIKKIDPNAFTTNNIGKTILKEEYRGISDIINGYSKGNIKLGYGHTKEYWKKNNNLDKETFAQFGRMYYENNKNVINTLEKLIPNTKRYIDDNLKKVAKDYV